MVSAEFQICIGQLVSFVRGLQFYQMIDGTGLHLMRMSMFRFLALPVMVSEPIDFINVHKSFEGTVYTRFEAGANPPWEGDWEDFKYEKFKAKNAPTYSGCYDWQLDMKKDEFLSNLTKEEKEAYRKRLDEHYTANAAEYHNERRMWYFIVHGGKCGLYQEYGRYKSIREENYEAGSYDRKKLSWKGATFHSLEDAKNFVQYCREEEGEHWQWPTLMPIHWGPCPDVEIWMKLDADLKELWKKLEEIADCEENEFAIVKKSWLRMLQEDAGVVRG